MPKDGYLVFLPDELEVLRVDHWEVWCGLPPHLRFVEAEARNPKLIGLRAETSNSHVWVVPGAVPAVQADPQTVLMALGKRAGEGMDFYVELVGECKNPVGYAKDFAAEKLRVLRKKAG